MWSLTSQRTSRISGPKNFRSIVKKDFFNTIDPNQTLDTRRGSVGRRTRDRIFNIRRPNDTATQRQRR
jgi:hypothetical protein